MRFRLIGWIGLALVATAMGGCATAQPTPTAQAEQAVLLNVKAAQPLIAGTVPTFNAAQPTMQIEANEADSAEQAVQQLCEGQAALTLLDRPLTTDERAMCTANGNTVVDFYVAEREGRTFIFFAREEVLRPTEPAATYLAYLFATEDLPLALEQHGFDPAPAGTYEENLGTLQVLLDRRE